MALYDMLGNFTGYQGVDSYDEERKRREEEEKKRRDELANTEIQTQQVTTYGDGSKTQTITTEIPASAQTQARAMPIPSTGPVSPDSFQKIRQMESGNRDYTPAGQPVTSSAGAMYASQVMPQTAQQPGFGVQPAQNQTPEEYNRVGQDYFNAMKKRYGNNEALAAAAYHSGPGNVDKALQQAQLTGNDWRSFLGPQGQQYVQKFTGQQTVQPTQEAQAPIPQVPQPLSQYNVAGTTGGQGLQMPTQQPTVEPTQIAQTQFQTNQDNLDAMLKMRGDQTVPEYLRKRASDRAYELMNQNVQNERANQKLQDMVQSGDTAAISKILTSKPKDDEGSWLKFALYGFISPQLAQAEAVKLGIAPTKWEDATMTTKNGETIAVQLQRRIDGRVVGGTKADGTPLSSQEIELAQGGASKLNIVGGSYVNDKTGEVGRMVTDEKTGKTYIQTDSGRKPMTGFRPQSSMGTLSDMRTRQIQEINLKLQGKGVEEQMGILRDYNKGLVSQGYQPVQPGEVGINVPQIGGAPTQQAPATPSAPAPTPAPTVSAPAPIAKAPTAPIAPGPVSQPAATGGGLGGRPTGAQLEAAKVQAKEEAQEVGTDIGKLKVNQGKSEQNADYLITKMDELVNHPGFSFSVGVANVGPVPLPGAGKLAGMIEGTDTSDWAARFNEIKGQSFLQAVENLRGMGSLSNQEGDAATKAIQRMSTSQSEKEFKAAADDFKEIIQRGIDRNREKLGQAPKYGTPAESAGQKDQTSGGVTSSGNKYKRVQ